MQASLRAFLLIIISLTFVSVTHAAPAAPVKKVSARQQLIIDVLPVFIKVYGNNPSNAEKIWWRKRIACGEINTEKQLLTSMAFHKSKKVRKGGENICSVKKVKTGAASVSKATSVMKKNIEISSKIIVDIGVFSRYDVR